MTIDVDRLAVDADYWDEVAPEGATHFMYSEKFVKWVDGVELSFYVSSERKWKKSFCSWSFQQYIDCGNYMIAKPKTQPTDTQPTESGAQISAEWENGIPPVGWHGECTWGNKENSHECVILPDLKIAINFYTSWSVDQISQLEGVEFCPIRSQANRERDTAIDYAFSKLTEFREARQVLGDLYDAGLLQMPDEDVAKNARGES
jgi:hypothetical protein